MPLESLRPDIAHTLRSLGRHRAADGIDAAEYLDPGGEPEARRLDRLRAFAIAVSEESTGADDAAVDVDAAQYDIMRDNTDHIEAYQSLVKTLRAEVEAYRTFRQAIRKLIDKHDIEDEF